MERLRRWTDWYEFARSALDYEHGEAETYARKRYLEELNRDKLAFGESFAAAEASDSGAPGRQFRGGSAERVTAMRRGSSGETVSGN